MIRLNDTKINQAIQKANRHMADLGNGDFLGSFRLFQAWIEDHFDNASDLASISIGVKNKTLEYKATMLMDLSDFEKQRLQDKVNHMEIYQEAIDHLIHLHKLTL